MVAQQRSRKHLGRVWLRAALLGSTWASLEIIIGSFLHNLRFPFAGAVLASIGVALLIAGQYLWKERGFLWRAGIICALMKSISPSAFIFGPMIGIVSEALLLTLFVAVLGRNRFSFLVGGACAVVLPLLQSIIGLLVIYGFDIARLYVEAYQLSAAFLHIEILRPIDLILLVAVIHFSLGLIAAGIGITVGRKTLEIRASRIQPSKNQKNFDLPPASHDQHFSLLLMISHAAIFVFGLMLIRDAALWISGLFLLMYIAICTKLYPVAAKRITRLKLWIEFAAITILAGILLKGIGQATEGWQWSGLQIGLQMTIRAAFVITVFASLSVELRNPLVLDWLLKRGLGRLSEALSVAFQALPTFTQSLNEEKNLFRHPVTSLARILATTAAWLEWYENAHSEQPRVIILSGEKGQGKTTLLKNLIDTLQKERIRVGGILASGIWKDGQRYGYNVLNISTEKQVTLCRTDAPKSDIQIGAFIFFPEGIDYGKRALSLESVENPDIVFIDEIGPLELEGKVWAESFELLLRSSAKLLVITVRTGLVEKVMAHFGFEPDLVLELDDSNSAEIGRKILVMIREIKGIAPIAIEKKNHRKGLHK